MIIHLDLGLSDAKALIRALDHLHDEAGGGGMSSYNIDKLCRKDCRARWMALRNYINSRIPKKYRPT